MATKVNDGVGCSRPYTMLRRVEHKADHPTINKERATCVKECYALDRSHPFCKTNKRSFPLDAEAPWI